MIKLKSKAWWHIRCNNKTKHGALIGKDKKRDVSKWIMKYKIDDKDMDKIEDYLKNRKK